MCDRPFSGSAERESGCSPCAGARHDALRRGLGIDPIDRDALLAQLRSKTGERIAVLAVAGVGLSLMLAIGELQKDHLGDLALAVRTYEEFLRKYPHSPHRREAQEGRAELALLLGHLQQLTEMPGHQKALR